MWKTLMKKTAEVDTVSIAAMTAVTAPVERNTIATDTGIVSEREATTTEIATGIMTRSFAMIDQKGGEMIGTGTQVAVPIIATVKSGIESIESTETSSPAMKGALGIAAETETLKSKGATGIGVVKGLIATNSAIIMKHRWCSSTQTTRSNETNIWTSTEKPLTTATRPCSHSTHAAISSSGSSGPTIHVAYRLTTATDMAATS